MHMIKSLYRHRYGRVLLYGMTRPRVSRAAGRYMDSRASRRWIKPFVRKNQIDLSDCVVEDWNSFNAFFTRELKPGARRIDRHPQAAIAPCDGLLTAVRINEENIVFVKDTPYTVESLLENREIARRYAGGVMLIYRLTPKHYHHYIYPDDCVQDKEIFIRGILHTVQPHALRSYPVYKTNSREYAILHTRHFGDVCFMEVGAMMVGRIKNLHRSGEFSRGEEKGMFEFGGSTIILLYESGALKLPDSLWQESRAGREVAVKLGQRIGAADRSDGRNERGD